MLLLRRSRGLAPTQYEQLYYQAYNPGLKSSDRKLTVTFLGPSRILWQSEANIIHRSVAIFD